MAEGFVTNYIVALAVVGVMLFGLYAVARGLSRGRVLNNSGKRLTGVVESSFLAQNTAVYVVRAGSRYLLVGGGSGHLTTLAELPAEEVEAWLAEQRQAHGAQVQSIKGAIAQMLGKRG